MTGDEATVYVTRTEIATYPDCPPFHPSVAYPEFPEGPLSEDQNDVYDAVRRVFIAAGLDPDNAGTPAWNPLGDLLNPGEHVVLKPNMVKENHPRDEVGWTYVLTHGSVIRAVADYVFSAVGPTGIVTIADAPQTDSSFARIAERMGLPALQAHYASRGLSLELVDLRKEEWRSVGGVIVERTTLAGDPRGAIAYDLGDRSAFAGHRGSGHYYGADYDIDEVNQRHSGGRHQYLLAGSVMAADAVINLPKLKTHKKAGVTLSLKNLVGVNADKNWLPHHTEGPPSAGGDERPQASVREKLERSSVHALHRLLVRHPAIGRPVARLARRGGTHIFGDTEEVIRSGNWWGNDTIWRTTLDLNRLLMYGLTDGSIGSEPCRRHFSLVDGVLGGHRRGPMNPDPLESRVILFGLNAVAVDVAATALMGFDPARVPTLSHAFDGHPLPLVSVPMSNVRLATPDGEWSIDAIPAEHSLHADPHPAWLGHL